MGTSVYGHASLGHETHPLASIECDMCDTFLCDGPTWGSVRQMNRRGGRGGIAGGVRGSAVQ